MWEVHHVQRASISDHRWEIRPKPWWHTKIGILDESLQRNRKPPREITMWTSSWITEELTLFSSPFAFLLFLFLFICLVNEASNPAKQGPHTPHQAAHNLFPCKVTKNGSKVIFIKVRIVLDNFASFWWILAEMCIFSTYLASFWLMLQLTSQNTTKQIVQK